MADVSQIRLPNGDTFDLIDEKSGYITAQYIENKTDYSIPVSRVGEIVVGETAIGTDSTNFPTSKAVVDYVDERVVQEIEAIDVGVTGIKANGTSLTVENGVVNIPIVGPNQTVGLMTDEYMSQIYNRIRTVGNDIPTSTSQLTNDSGFITSETDPTVPDWAKAATKPTYTASEVGALPSDTVIPEDKVFIATYNSTTYADTLTAYNAGKLIFAVRNGGSGNGKLILPLTRYTGTAFQFEGQYLSGYTCKYFLTLQSSGWSESTNYGYPISKDKDIASGDRLIIRDSNTSTGHINTMKASTLTFGSDTTQYLANNGTWQSIPSIPTNISAFTNDSGYLTSSDIASVLTYKGTKASYSALPSSGNSTGDVWHVTDTGAEYAWDGTEWQELGTAIDLSNYATKATTLAGYGITDAKIQNGTITLGSNTITPLTSYTEMDPVFSASAASGITATDISNWNAKISDTGKWNGVELANFETATANDYYVPAKTTVGSTSGTASWLKVTRTPGNYSIAQYDNGYLKSTTPSANDNSTKVATTAYVDAAIPDVSGYISNITYDATNRELKRTINGTTSTIVDFGTAAFKLVTTAITSNSSNLPTDGAVIEYVNNAIPKVYSSTNTGGYLTMATLPIYDGTVE